MQRTQLSKRPALVLLACLVVLALSLIATAASVAHTAALAWSPIYTPSDGEVWYPAADVSKQDGGPGGPTACSMDTAGTDGRGLVKPVWTSTYARQTDQTTFRICGTFSGQGQVLLAYPGAGKPIDFDYTTPTNVCVDTYSASASDGTPRALDLYLVQLGTRTASISAPSILVGEQR